MSKRSLSAGVLLAAALALPAAGPAAAQRIDDRRVFDVSLSYESRTMEGSIREGSSLRLLFRSTNAEYLFMPRLVRGNRVAITVYRATPQQPGTRRMVQTVEVPVGQVRALRTEPVVNIVVDQVRITARPTQVSMARPISFAATDAIRAAVQSDQCCVSCGSELACACGVKMWCGSCCMPSCCKISQTGNEMPRLSAPGTFFAGGGNCGDPVSPAPAPVSAIASR